jgi:outer membrane beta-barrel protein
MQPQRLAWVMAAWVLGFGAHAHAQSGEEGTITVIQPKPILRANRVTLTPMFGMSINEPMLRQYTAGGTLAFNIGERWSVGGSFDWFDFQGVLGGPTDRYEQVIAETFAIPEVANLRWYAGVDVGFVPVYGKLVLFNRLIGYWDLELFVGGGVVESGQEVHGAGSFGASLTVYPTRWLGITTQVRDRISMEALPSGDALVHTVTSTVGLRLFVPFGFEYSGGTGR